MACPICNSPEGSAIGDGIRAGAAVLILFSTIVIGAIARYIIRIWATERSDGTETNDRTATT
jgi:hypothetical protein